MDGASTAGPKKAATHVASLFLEDRKPLPQDALCTPTKPIADSAWKQEGVVRVANFLHDQKTTATKKKAKVQPRIVNNNRDLDECASDEEEEDQEDENGEGYYDEEEP